MNEWSHLPNVKHIDWVLQSLKDSPATWYEAWNVASETAWNKARAAAWYSARTAARTAVRYAERDAARTAAYDAVWNAAAAARDAILAFIAFDYCEKYLNMSYEQLLIWAELDPHPACVLLLPYAYAKDKLTKEVDLV